MSIENNMDNFLDNMDRKMMGEDELQDIHSRLGINTEKEYEEPSLQQKNSNLVEEEAEFIKPQLKNNTQEMVVEKPKRIPIEDEQEVKPVTRTTVNTEMEAAKPEIKKEEVVKPIINKEGRQVPNNGGANRLRKMTSDILSTIKVDLDNIELIEKPEIEKINDVKLLIDNKPTYQVVANQSCYIAHMESLKLPDINAIAGSTADPYAERQKFYQTVFSKINNTSLGKITYKTFLNITSYYDLPTLLFGIYNQTFPTDTEFTIDCPFCKKEHKLKINNNSLICIKDEQIYKSLHSVISGRLTPEELVEKSLVHKYNRIILPKSKIIVDIMTPTLSDNLTILGSIDRNKIADNIDLIGTMMFIKNMFMLDTNSLLKEKKAKYYALKNKNEYANIIRSIELEDIHALTKAIDERKEKYGITYSIKGFNCASCGKKIEDIPVDMEQLLFHQLLQM